MAVGTLSLSVLFPPFLTDRCLRAALGNERQARAVGGVPEGRKGCLGWQKLPDDRPYPVQMSELGDPYPGAVAVVVGLCPPAMQDCYQTQVRTWGVFTGLESEGLRGDADAPVKMCVGELGRASPDGPHGMLGGDQIIA